MDKMFIADIMNLRKVKKGMNCTTCKRLQWVLRPPDPVPYTECLGIGLGSIDIGDAGNSICSFYRGEKIVVSQKRNEK